MSYVGKMNKFKDAETSLKEAKARMHDLVVERARALYPHYDDYAEDDSSFESACVITREVCREEALKSLQSGKTAEEELAEREANRRIHRSIMMPPGLDDKLRIVAFRSNRVKNDIMVEAMQVYLDALGDVKW